MMEKSIPSLGNMMSKSKICRDTLSEFPSRVGFVRRGILCFRTSFGGSVSAIGTMCLQMSWIY